MSQLSPWATHMAKGDKKTQGMSSVSALQASARLVSLVCSLGSSLSLPFPPDLFSPSWEQLRPLSSTTCVFDLMLIVAPLRV